MESEKRRGKDSSLSKKHLETVKSFVRSHVDDCAHLRLAASSRSHRGGADPGGECPYPMATGGTEASGQKVSEQGCQMC